MDNFRKQWYTILTFVRISTKRFFRDRVALFFSIGFPLIFLFVFGSLNSNSSNVSFNIAIINQSSSSFAKDFVSQAESNKAFKVNKEVKDLDTAKQKMSRSELDAAIILPSNFGEASSTTRVPSGELEVVYTQNNQTSGTALTSILQAQFKEVNAKLVQTETPFTVKGEQLNEKSLTAFDYTFAGLLGFAIIGMGIFGPINVFPELKKMGILRRLSTTPLKVWQYFVSTMIGQAFIGLISLAIMFIVAIAVFHLTVVGSWALLIAFLVLSITMILGIGLALGGWASSM